MMLRKIKAAAAAVALLAVSLGAALGTSAPAGAQSGAPCGGGSGWFDSYNPSTNAHSAINCWISGNHIVVERGLVRGEDIVVEGYHKLQHGMKVEPVAPRRDEEAEKQQ